MAVLYLMRHGQTQFNIEKKVQGWVDSPLTELGKEQALHMKKELEKKGITFHHAYSSDLGRAVATMRLVTGQACPMYTVKDLREISFGDLDGKYSWQLDEARYHEHPEDFHGESGEQACLRALNALRTIAAREAEDPGAVLVVAHSGIMYFLYPMLDKLKGYDWPEEMEVPNGTVFEIDANGDYLVLQGVLMPDGTEYGHFTAPESDNN